MAEKLVANKGLLKIPEDIFDFEGPNGEHELSTTLTKKTFITVQFPNAKNQSEEVKQLVVYSHDQTVKVRICAEIGLGLTKKTRRFQIRHCRGRKNLREAGAAVISFY
jgi:hypothetical protein